MTQDLRVPIVGISGATGLIGAALQQQLRASGHRVLTLVRRREQANEGSIWWDPSSPDNDLSALAGARAVVHLAGENVAQRRWSEAQKRRIHDSRQLGTENLSRSLAKLDPRPSLLISASGIGFYGNRGERLMDETEPAGPGFLSRVCIAWEAGADAARAAGIRVVHPRIGMVLAAEGGALAKMLPVFRLGLGARMGSGQQYLSWISLPDLVRVLLFAITTPTLSGPVNAVSPNAVSNIEFTRTLARVLGRPAPFVVPAAALRLALGELSTELLSSQRVRPGVLEHAGFQFQHPELEGALRAVLG
jgi:uncharacterized protein (TIGR01777 family)